MLLTRCPACTTAFRITAELLKRASGQVRCGHCNYVFAAFAHLEEAEAEPDAHGIGSYAPPAETPVEPPPELTDELSETNEYEALVQDMGAEGLESPDRQVQDASEPGSVDQAAAEPVTADELVEIFDGDPAKAGESSGGETLATENKVLLATIDPDQPLDLELPPDEWQAFYEAEGLADHSATIPRVESVLMDSATQRGTIPGDGAVADAADGVDESDIAEVGEPESEASAATEATDADGGEHDEEEEPQGHVIDLEQAHGDAILATLGEEDDRPWALATATRTSRLPELDPLWWRIGSAALAFVLLLQLGHHYRNDLATTAGVGAVVRALYGGLDADIAPDWDVQQYEIDDWIATAQPNQDGQDSLTITATLLNRGPRDQPHPYVRLELKDRWDESVGSRVFTPGEYLPEPPAPGALMASGSKVPALLAVVDPGNDAYGFELDVCMPSGPDQLRCANQSVF